MTRYIEIKFFFCFLCDWPRGNLSEQPTAPQNKI
jgi:hypothetical protein